MSSASRKIRQVLASVGMDTTEMISLDKEKEIRRTTEWMLNKTLEMFEYDNLPSSMPKYWLEYLLQTQGMAIVTRLDNLPSGYGPYFSPASLVAPDDIYAMFGSLAGGQDPTYLPHQVVIANPGFTPSVSRNLEINKDCVVIRNDSTCSGLLNVHRKYAALLVEAEISIRSTLIVLRDAVTFQVQTETQRSAVEQYMKDKAAGKFATILAPNLTAPIQAYPENPASNSVELAVAGRQAIYVAWAHELGLDANLTSKREYVSAQQIGESADMLLPVIDNMLHNREEGVAAINDLFGTNITVRKSSTWELKDIDAYATEEEISEGGETDVQSEPDVE